MTTAAPAQSAVRGRPTTKAKYEMERRITQGEFMRMVFTIAPLLRAQALRAGPSGKHDDALIRYELLKMARRIHSPMDL